MCGRHRNRCANRLAQRYVATGLLARSGPPAIAPQSSGVVKTLPNYTQDAPYSVGRTRVTDIGSKELPPAYSTQFSTLPQDVKHQDPRDALSEHFDRSVQIKDASYDEKAVATAGQSNIGVYLSGRFADKLQRQEDKARAKLQRKAEKYARKQAALAKLGLRI